MPNHIQNRLKIIATNELVQQVLDFISTTHEDGSISNIDFNNIIPMPSELMITSDGFLMCLENRFCHGESMKDNLDKLREYKIKDPKYFEETSKNFMQGVQNYITHGHATWHSWSVIYWGTKWNAYETEDQRNEFDTIYFQTAWSSPFDLMIKLSAKFPDAKFQFDYADEDVSSNTGMITLQGGVIIKMIKPQSGTIEAYEIYFDLHPDSKNDWHIVNGVYEYKED